MTEHVRKYNILKAPLLSIGSGRSATLPGLFAAMARGEDVHFPALRPHQRPAWHMFCVQLAALALWHGGEMEPPRDEDAWRTLLRGLTPDFPDDEPWCLVVEDRSKPAFMQPPDPGGLKWTPVLTPDALDMLITSRNHDLKQQVMVESSPEDWLFALVSLQTMEGYGGKGNYGIARMNGGSSSRMLLGLAPARSTGDVSPAPAPWWRRDVKVLLDLRQSGKESGPCKPGGKAIVWMDDWPEGVQLHPPDLDPWFVEVCRRIRLHAIVHGLRAEKANSKHARIDAKVYKGNLGDPWAPVEIKEGKTLTLGENGRFDYKRLNDLLLSSNWALPLCAQSRSEEGDMLLVAEAIARGNSRTGGFSSRIIPVPAGMASRFGAPEMKKLAEEQIREIGNCDKALRNGLALLAANGNREAVKTEHYSLTRPARAAFDARADAMFFPALWDRVQANDKSNAALEAARARFQSRLAKAAWEEFEAALPTIPCASLFRPRAEARARAVFRASLRKAGFDLPASKEEHALDQI